MTNVQKKEPADKQGSTSSIAKVAPVVNKIKTIKLNGNIDYAKVSARLAEFHKANKNGTLETSYDFREGMVIFRAKLTPDVAKPERSFPGTSLGKLGATKAFEKLETIAVGRALAFAGYLSDGEIASSEEMEKYEEPVIQVDSESAIAKLNTAKNLAELQLVWQRLTAAERQNEDIAFTKEELKSAFMEVEGENI